jgi:hypothetical protein
MPRIANFGQAQVTTKRMQSAYANAYAGRIPSRYVKKSNTPSVAARATLLMWPDPVSLGGYPS